LSLTHSMVTEKLKAKKAAQWIGDPKKFTALPIHQMPARRSRF